MLWWMGAWVVVVVVVVMMLLPGFVGLDLSIGGSQDGGGEEVVGVVSYCCYR